MPNICTRVTSIIAGFLLAGMLAGCVTTHDKSKQLARVAKDWCLTIRASQVIPVYPLVEDLQPGDVFLTQTAIGEEVRQFEERGFLPLDQRLYRIPEPAMAKALKAHYSHRYSAADDVFPTASRWENIPDAKFPNYVVEVSRSGGLNLAIPVQGIPVGLNLLGSGAATASITIAEASTYGLDIASLQPMLRAWTDDAEIRQLLSPYGSFPGDPQATPAYARVVTRVFYTGKVDIHLEDRQSFGGEAKAGIELPLSAPANLEGTETRAEMYNNIASNLNATLTQQIGGRVRLIGLSSRSVSLTEDFEHPVVVGYLAYDCLILPDGSLGPPVATMVRVSGSGYTPAYTNFDTAGYITAWYTKDGKSDERTALMQAWIARNEPGASPVEVLSQDRFEDSRRRMIRDLNIR